MSERNPLNTRWEGVLAWLVMVAADVANVTIWRLLAFSAAHPSNLTDEPRAV